MGGSKVPIKVHLGAATMELVAFGLLIGAVYGNTLWLSIVAGLLATIFAFNFVARLFFLMKIFAVAAAVANSLAEGLDKHGCGDVDCKCTKEGETNG